MSRLEQIVFGMAFMTVAIVAGTLFKAWTGADLTSLFAFAAGAACAHFTERRAAE